jgi:hypothetical protein
VRQLDWHLEGEDFDALREVGAIDPARWSATELARAFMLLAAGETLPTEEHTALVEEAFRKGDSAERCALLKSLALMPAPERFLKTATEASRTQVQEVF